MGRDSSARGLPCRADGFNSRARMGRDRASAPAPIVRVVSIHAPAWGATGRAARCIAACAGFNSRARMGRDAAPLCAADGKGKFQFTRPHGARRALHPRRARVAGFNSRARMGRDGGPPSRCRRSPRCFNSRARMGRDATGGVLRALARVSIHAPAWGATIRLVREVRDNAKVSIHAPAWGATQTIIQAENRDTFQFTRPHGARRPARTTCRPIR